MTGYGNQYGDADNDSLWQWSTVYGNSDNGNKWSRMTESKEYIVAVKNEWTEREKTNINIDQGFEWLPYCRNDEQLKFVRSLCFHHWKLCDNITNDEYYSGIISSLVV